MCRKIRKLKKNGYFKCLLNVFCVRIWFCWEEHTSENLASVAPKLDNLGRIPLVLANNTSWFPWSSWSPWDKYTLRDFCALRDFVLSVISCPSWFRTLRDFVLSVTSCSPWFRALRDFVHSVISCPSWFLCPSWLVKGHFDILKTNFGTPEGGMDCIHHRLSSLSGYGRTTSNFRRQYWSDQPLHTQLIECCGRENRHFKSC